MRIFKNEKQHLTKASLGSKIFLFPESPCLLPLVWEKSIWDVHVSSSSYLNPQSGSPSWWGETGWLPSALGEIPPSPGFLWYNNKSRKQFPSVSLPITEGWISLPSPELISGFQNFCFPLGGGRADWQAGQHGVRRERRWELQGALRSAVSCFSPRHPMLG